MQQTHRNYSYQKQPVKPGSRLEVKSSRRRLPYRNLLVLVGVLGLMFVITKGVVASNNGQPKQTVASTANLQEQKKPEPPKKVVDTTGLTATLAETIKKYPYNTSVSVIDLNSGQIYQSGDTYPFLAASTTKLLTAMLYLNNVEAGQASLSSQIGTKSAKDQLQAMINQSDNDAWITMNDHLSRESLGVYAKKHGITSYDPTKNTVTSNDIAMLLAKLYKRELLNEQYTSLLLSWMQNTSEERFIPPSIPKEHKLYHKSGYLQDRIHDVAIVDNGSTPFVLVIYSKTYGNQVYNYASGQKLFGEVTSSVVTVFNR